MQKILYLCVFIFTLIGIGFAEEDLGQGKNSLGLDFGGQNYRQTQLKQHYFGIEAGWLFPVADIDYGVGSQSYMLEAGGDLGLKYTFYFNANIGLTVRYSGSNFSTKESDKWYIQDRGNLSGPFTNELRFNTNTSSFGVALKYGTTDMEVFTNFGLANNTNTVKDVIKYNGAKISEEKKEASNIGLFIDTGARFYISDMFALEALLRYTTNNQKFEDLNNIKMSTKISGGLFMSVGLTCML